MARIRGPWEYTSALEYYGSEVCASIITAHAAHCGFMFALVSCLCSYTASV